MWGDVLFKRKRSIRLSYYRQGLIYFLCANYSSLPKLYRDAIDRICSETGGDYRDALFAVLTEKERNTSSVSMQYFVSNKRLFNLRARFYEEFWKQVFMGCEAYETKETKVL